MDQYSTSLLVLSILWVVTFVARYLEGSWFALSSISLLVWSGVVSMSMLLAPSFYFSPAGLIIITLLLSTMLLGSLTAGHIYAPNVLAIASDKHIPNKGSFIRTRPLSLLMLAASGIGLLAAPALLQAKGFSLGSLLSISSYVSITNELSVARYTGFVLPGHITLLLAMGYAGAMFGGLLFATAKTAPLRALALLSIVPLVAFTFVYTTRATTLYGLILFIASNISGRLYHQSYQFTLFNKTNIAIGLIALIALPSMFLVTQIARAGISGVDLNIVLSVLHHLKSWFMGNISGFSIWFDTNLYADQPAWGLYTFSGIFDYLGIEKRNPGVFKEMVYIEPERINATNIYTLFRFLIADFGIIGTALIMYGVGFLGKVLFKKVLSGGVGSIPLLSSLYIVIFWSFVASILAYNSILLAVVIFSVAILQLSKPQTSNA